MATIPPTRWTTPTSGSSGRASSVAPGGSPSPSSRTRISTPPSTRLASIQTVRAWACRWALASASLTIRSAWPRSSSGSSASSQCTSTRTGLSRKTWSEASTSEARRPGPGVGRLQAEQQVAQGRGRAAEHGPDLLQGRVQLGRHVPRRRRTIPSRRSMAARACTESSWMSAAIRPRSLSCTSMSRRSRSRRCRASRSVRSRSSKASSATETLRANPSSSSRVCGSKSPDWRRRG